MERKLFHQTNDDKAPERIWAWDDKTPTERDKGWSACDAGTGSTGYVRADLHEAVQAEITRLTAERDQAITALSKAAEARGRAEGKLAASELPWIVDGWKTRAERAEAERDTLRAENERLRGSLRKIEVGLDFIAADDTTEDARMAGRLLPIARAALAKGGE